MADGFGKVYCNFQITKAWVHAATLKKSLYSKKERKEKTIKHSNNDRQGNANLV